VGASQKLDRFKGESPAVSRPQCLNIVPRPTIHRLINDGIIAGEQITSGAPWRIRLTDGLKPRSNAEAGDGFLPMREAIRALGVSSHGKRCCSACQGRRARSRNAYGYRPRRSAADAIKAVHELLCQGYTDVVDADLSKYLDPVSYCPLVHEASGKRSGRREDADAG
jgi:hypothetical protein